MPDRVELKGMGSPTSVSLGLQAGSRSKKVPVPHPTPSASVPPLGPIVSMAIGARWGLLCTLGVIENSCRFALLETNIFLFFAPWPLTLGPRIYMRGWRRFV